MFFEWMNDLAVRVGLATLIVLTIVKAIDGLAPDAILTDTLPDHQREKARLASLSPALMASIAEILTLATPTMERHKVSRDV